MRNFFSKQTLPWLLPVGGFFLWAGIFGFWTSDMSYQVLHQLITVNPLFLWFISIGLLSGLWLNRNVLAALLKEMATPRQWAALATIGLLGFALVYHVAPRTHRLFYDEDIYQAIALNIAQNNQAAMNNDGRWEYGQFRSKLTEFNKQPNAWPFLIGAAFRFFGVSEDVAFNLANALFLLTTFLVFVAGRLLFAQARPGLLAALIFVCIPENLRWFSTMDGDPPTACFVALAVVCTLIFIRFRGPKLLFLTVCAWAFAVQFRYEVFLLAALVFLILYIEGWEEFKSPWLYAFGLLFLVLISAHLAHLLMVRNESWGSSGAKFSSGYVLRNLHTNVLYYWDGKLFPILYSLLSVLGLVFSSSRRGKLYAGLWFLLTWGIFPFFYAGSYQFGVDVRFAINSMVPLALLAGAGANGLVTWLEKRASRANALFAVGLLIVVPLIYYWSYFSTESQESWQCRADHEAAAAFAALVPKEGIVLTHNPNMFQIMGKNAAQMSLLTERSEYAQNVLFPQFHDKIYLHWNYWCNTQDPRQVAFCQNILNAHQTKLIAESVTKDQRFALYQVLPESQSTPPKK